MAKRRHSPSRREPSPRDHEPRRRGRRQRWRRLPLRSRGSPREGPILDAHPEDQGQRQFEPEVEHQHPGPVEPVGDIRLVEEQRKQRPADRKESGDDEDGDVRPWWRSRAGARCDTGSRSSTRACSRAGSTTTWVIGTSNRPRAWLTTLLQPVAVLGRVCRDDDPVRRVRAHRVCERLEAVNDNDGRPRWSGAQRGAESPLDASGITRTVGEVTSGRLRRVAGQVPLRGANREGT